MRHAPCLLYHRTMRMPAVWLPAALFLAAHTLMYMARLQLIRKMGLTKLSGRTIQHNIDAAEADMIWAIHKAAETRLELRKLVYSVSQLQFFECISTAIALKVTCHYSRPVITLGQAPTPESRLARAAFLHVGCMH